AHARMSGIFRVAAREPAQVTADGVDLGALTMPEEIDLLNELTAFPGLVARAADALEPHRITGYLEGLGRIAHAWYHKYRVLGEPEVRGGALTGVDRAPGASFRWKARYSYDLASRETLETRLGVFAAFRPKLPERFRNARYVFLGNIDPELQLGVLDQVRDPILVACDTMNYWIHSRKDLLLELLRHIDILRVNDSEARELSGDWNIYRAAQWVLSREPTMTVIKQGEHGALLVDAESVFKVPAYPLQEVTLKTDSA